MKAAAVRSLELDPDLVEGLTALGACAAFHEWHLAEAEQHFRRALAVNPNYVTAYLWYGNLLENIGRQSENVALRRRALELDPLNLRAGAALGYALFLAGRPEEAVARLRATLDLDPAWYFARHALGVIHVTRGDLADAIAEFNAIADRSSLGHALGLAARTAEARDLLGALEESSRTSYVSPVKIALVHIGLGQYDDALTRLEAAFEQRAIDLSGVNADPRFAPLRTQQRFRALVGKMNSSEVA
jgi:tetratricopeptide (TPR) repeat protein